jgi:solute carrier family 30 (zinc transporter), member 6
MVHSSSIFYLIKSSHSRTTVLISLATLCACIIVFTMAGQANSMALQAFCSLCIFDLLFVGTALLSAWIIENNNSKVQQKLHSSNNHSIDSSTSLFLPTQTITTFSYGTARFEVLAVFTSTMLSILGAFFILKESIEKYLEDETIHTEYLFTASLVTFAIHMIVIYLVPNQAFDHVIAASSSSWLQEHVSDMFQSVCHYIPGLSRLLLPRINPFALLCWCGLAIIFSDSFLLKMGYGNFVDTLSSLSMAFMTFGTMVPMAIYSGKILLQTTPAPMIGQLDKCLHEALRLDGVLQFRHEHFWALSFGTLVGSLHVRCR